MRGDGWTGGGVLLVRARSVNEVVGTISFMENKEGDKEASWMFWY